MQYCVYLSSYNELYAIYEMTETEIKTVIELEKWLKESKTPKISLDKALNTSSEIIKRIPDLPKFMDQANNALKLIAEGKLNIISPNDEAIIVEGLKIKNFRNNIIISLLGVVIVGLIVF